MITITIAFYKFLLIVSWIDVTISCICWIVFLENMQNILTLSTYLGWILLFDEYLFFRGQGDFYFDTNAVSPFAKGTNF